ncbi:MAG: hypothetical protein RLZZ450_771 [Pseudomonadota bacterium]|jgi:hypothetical protein
MVVLVALLRLVALLVATELSGAAHAVLDVAASAVGVEHPRDDCDDEEAGHECPPGCPNCHCAHGAVVQLVPRGEARPALRLALLHPERDEAGFVPLDAMPPKGADLTPLYRPPRAALAS